jgi:hypothetical protein
VVDLAAIEALPLADAIRRSVWAYPVLEAIHICGFAALVGALLVLELRVFGAHPELPLPVLGQVAIPVALAGFVVAAACGVLMFVSSATELGRNPAFLLKLGLILMAAVNALVFHARDGLRRPDAAAKFQAALSVLLWFGAVFAGRLIAYV